LALNGEEGRGKLRKAAGTGRHGSIRRYPNGATRVVEDYSHPQGGHTRRTETSHYPQEQKTTVIPLVVASEHGTAQTGFVEANPGLKDWQHEQKTKANLLERRARERDSRVAARFLFWPVS
jgi:hypothetical protein